MVILCTNLPKDYKNILEVESGQIKNDYLDIMFNRFCYAFTKCSDWKMNGGMDDNKLKSKVENDESTLFSINEYSSLILFKFI